MDKKLTSTICWSNFDHDHRCNRLDGICIRVPLLTVYHHFRKQNISHFYFTLISIVNKICFSLTKVVVAWAQRLAARNRPGQNWPVGTDRASLAQ